eukprot:14955483-Alexandrium_andersonii.AAC.1
MQSRWFPVPVLSSAAPAAAFAQPRRSIGTPSDSRRPLPRSTDAHLTQSRLFLVSVLSSASPSAVCAQPRRQV